MIGFLQSGYLWFLPLAGAPVVIHLLTRRRPVILPFPDLRFIRQASESIIRRHRLHEKWLLAARCLAIALAALLFARPVFRLSPAAGAVDAGATAVIVLDVSYSMTCREGGRSRLETARETARALVGLMSPRDRVALVLASDLAQSVIPNPVPPQSERLLAAIAEASATFRSTDIQAALAEGGRILSATAAGDSLKQVILISDFARHGWASRTGEPATAGRLSAMLPKGIAVLAVQVGESEPDNLALGDPRLEEPAGDRIPLTVRVLSPGRPRSDGVSILASVEGTRVTEGFARFPSAGAPEVMKTLPLTISRPGPFDGYAELREPGGAMNVDNRVWFAGVSQPPLRTVIIDGAPGVSSYTGEAYYVRTALAPKAGGAPLVILTQSELDTADLSRADAVVLCNPAGLTLIARQKLSAHVRRGGGLGLFLGDQADPEKITREFGELLPARLITRSHGKWGIAWVDESHPALALLADPAQADWTPVRVTGLIQAEPLASARILIRCGPALRPGTASQAEAWATTDGPPLVIEGTLADPRAGRIVLITTSADRDWTNLPARPVFLPLLQRLIRHAVRASDPGLAAGGLVVGLPGRIPLPARELPSQFDVEWPDGSRSRVAPARSREFTGLDLGVLEQPGIIRIHWRVPDSGESRETRLAVNLPVASGESDLRRASRAEVEKAVTGSPVAWLASGPGLEKDYLSAVRGKDASRSIAAALLGLLALELFAASRRPQT